MFGSNYNLYL